MKGPLLQLLYLMLVSIWVDVVLGAAGTSPAEHSTSFQPTKSSHRSKRHVPVENTSYMKFPVSKPMHSAQAWPPVAAMGYGPAWSPHGQSLYSTPYPQVDQYNKFTVMNDPWKYNFKKDYHRFEDVEMVQVQGHSPVDYVVGSWQPFGEGGEVHSNGHYFNTRTWQNVKPSYVRARK